MTTSLKPPSESQPLKSQEEKNILWERRLRMIQKVSDNSQTVALIRNEIRAHHYTPKQKIEQIYQTIPLMNESKTLVQCLQSDQLYQMVKYLAFQLHDMTQQLIHSTMTKRDKEKLQTCINELLAFKDW
jgi:hypothetical protein